MKFTMAEYPRGVVEPVGTREWPEKNLQTGWFGLLRSSNDPNCEPESPSRSPTICPARKKILSSGRPYSSARERLFARSPRQVVECRKGLQQQVRGKGAESPADDGSP